MMLERWLTCRPILFPYAAGVASLAVIAWVLQRIIQ